MSNDGALDPPMMSDGEYTKRLEVHIKRLETENEENDDEWKRIMYYLVNAVHAQRGKSIPEDVEHAKDEIERVKEERDDLARALFRIRSLTMQGRGNQLIAQIACDAVLHIDETPLFPVQAAKKVGGANNGSD